MCTKTGLEVIERLGFLASFPLPSTGKTEGGEKTQPFNHFQSRLGTLFPIKFASGRHESISGKCALFRVFSSRKSAPSSWKIDLEDYFGTASRVRICLVKVLHCMYMVSYLLMDLGWVDYDFECFTVCPILPGLTGIWQKRLGS